jgi:hypothetical protein
MREQILLGTLLGDGYIGKLQNRSKSYSIVWEHSLEQSQYAIWKAENSLPNYSVYKRERFDSRTNSIYKSIRCYSRVEDYKEYRDLFYQESKEVCQEILDKLKPLGVAVWFMDDGNLYYNGNCCHLNLAVNGFNQESVDRIVAHFKYKYGIIFKKSGKALRLTSVKQIEIWDSIFSQYYHESMLYKTLKFQKNKYNNKLSNERKKFRNNKYK